jgi:choline dehydrogenase-like flavoprotein
VICSGRRKRADAVDLVVDEDGSRLRRTVRCGRVVVAAGSVETPRLLLASGLGNDQLGRHLHGHRLSLVTARAPQRLPRFRGPGHSVATLAAAHDGRAPLGGGVMYDMFSPYPLQFARMAGALGGPVLGVAHKRWMRTETAYVIGVMGMGQELPLPHSRIELHPSIADRNGVPAVVTHRADHPLTRANQDHLTSAASVWLSEAGCTDVRENIAIFAPTGPGSPITEHAVGTARMGDDPARSATDRFGLLHGTRNIHVADGSLLPTSGGVNPTLTLMANVLRAATHWAEDQRTPP